MSSAPRHAEKAAEWNDYMEGVEGVLESAERAAAKVLEAD